ncbi:hypothetical protein Bca52824_042262 [Brassica carinata]|uniref:Uncharacterized protein n=1 Tax=Brassica carinata TaxID=52824 RepID=A0A8X7RY32_BRACI|nr:hypothetical protein Bca52824_042262 [Brassica carinata]
MEYLGIDLSCFTTCDISVCKTPSDMEELQKQKHWRTQFLNFLHEPLGPLKSFLFLNLSIVLTGFALGVFTNGTILSQILMYQKAAADDQTLFTLWVRLDSDSSAAV